MTLAFILLHNYVFTKLIQRLLESSTVAMVEVEASEDRSRVFQHNLKEINKFLTLGSFVR